MKSAPLPTNEAARLQSLQEHQLLDTLPEEVYDDITRIASEICGTPIALLSLVGKDRQWFKSKQGLEATETPREQSFCAHAILNPDDIFIVPDARYDERFHDNPLVSDEAGIVFYAGVPVKDAHGHPLGTLCVIDKRPRELVEQKVIALKSLAKLVSTHFELRKTKIDLEASRTKLSEVMATAGNIINQINNLTANGLSPDQQQQLQQLSAAAQALQGQG